MSALLDRGYSYEGILSTALEVRISEFATPVDILATVRNYTPRCNPRALWRLCHGASQTKTENENGSGT